MKLYLIRHGETDWNKARKMQGKSDIPLNEYGRELARETAEGLKDIAFDGIFTSPLRRAKETAAIIAGDRKIPVIEDKRIEEMGFGVMEGYSLQGDSACSAGQEFSYVFSAPDKYEPPEQGESFQEVKQRVLEFLDDIFREESYRSGIYLISTHGAILKTMLRHFKDLPLEQFWSGKRQYNCAVTIVEVTAGKAEILEEGILYYTHKDAVPRNAMHRVEEKADQKESET